MPRNPHPCSIEELERDDQLYGPAGQEEELRIEVELAHRHLISARKHIERSRAVLQQTASKFLPGPRRGD